MIIVVPKIGTGLSIEDAIRPDMNVEHWQVIEERETEFVIEVLD